MLLRLLQQPWELSVPGNHSNNGKALRPKDQSAGRRLVQPVVSPLVLTRGAAQTQHAVTNLLPKRRPKDVRCALDLSTTPVGPVYIVVALAIEVQNVCPADRNPVHDATRQWVPTRANALSARMYSRSLPGKQPSAVKPACVLSTGTHAPARTAVRQFHQKKTKIMSHLEVRTLPQLNLFPQPTPLPSLGAVMSSQDLLLLLFVLVLQAFQRLFLFALPPQLLHLSLTQLLVLRLPSSRAPQPRWSVAMQLRLLPQAQPLLPAVGWF